MKRLISILVFALSASTANAYHTGISETPIADDNASCNAAFHAGCSEEGHDDHDDTTSSSAVAAPAGALGGSVPEIVLIVALVAGAAGRWPSRFRKS